MADVTGALHIDHAGKSYSLFLSFRSIAKLQSKHGKSIGGLLNGEAEKEGIDANVALDVVAAALVKGEKMDASAAEDLADDILHGRIMLVGELLRAAFGSDEADAGGKGQSQGNAKRPKRAA